MELFIRIGQNGRKQSRFYQKRIEINRILSECKEYIIEWSFVVIEYNILEWSEHSRVEQNFIRIGRIEQYSTVSELNRLEGHILVSEQNRTTVLLEQNRLEWNFVRTLEQNSALLECNRIWLYKGRRYQNGVSASYFIRRVQNRMVLYQNKTEQNRFLSEQKGKEQKRVLLEQNRKQKGFIRMYQNGVHIIESSRVEFSTMEF